MKITSIKFSKPQNKEGAVKQFVSICLDEQLLIRSLRVVETKAKKLFVSFPNRKRDNGDRMFSSFPINEEFRLYVETTVLEAFKELPETEELVTEDPLQEVEQTSLL